MMNDNLQKALSRAIDIEFSWIKDFENPYEEYAFSPEFEANMQDICKKSNYTYVTVGSKRIRKSLIAILVALFVLAASGCAVITKYIVTWNETQNDKHGTLDVTFDIEGPETEGIFEYKTPTTPIEYTSTIITKDSETHIIEFVGPEGETIIYSQQSMDESMSLSLDNENAYFEEITINGYKGYKSFKEGVSSLHWSDGLYYYNLQGTCEINTLKEMAESLTL